MKITPLMLVGGVAGFSGLALGATSLLAPSTEEQLAAAMRANDARGAQRAAAGARPVGAGAAILLARSLLMAGKADRALEVLIPVGADHPDDGTVADLLERAYVMAGRDGERLALLRARALREPVGDTIRAWRTLAVAAHDATAEREALALLHLNRLADTAEIERLAALDEDSGGGEAAYRLLAERFRAEPAMPTPAVQRLMRLAIRHGDAATIGAALATLSQRQAPPTRMAVIDDLRATGRLPVALAIADGAPAAEQPALWSRRFAIVHAAGKRDMAAALLAGAVAAPGVPPADIVQAAYALDRPDQLLVAAEHGAIPRPTPVLALDIARRLADQPAAIARLDRVAGTDWRRGDPWLALRLAKAVGDQEAALRYAAMLPGAAADQAREQVLVDAGDKPRLRTLLIDRARHQPATIPAVAERLLSVGYRDDAEALLRTAAVQAGPDAPVTERLLYLMGPRPDAEGLAWLRRRAAAGNAPNRLAWLMLYARRDRPSRALAALEADPLAARTDVLLTRLDLAVAARDPQATTRAARTLLDGRRLTPAQLRTAGLAIPAGIDPALRLAFARQRIAHDIALPTDRMDIAWTQWNAGDAKAARQAVADQLAVAPRDVAALTLMADIEAKAGGERRAQPWLRSAYAASGNADSRARAALLRRLGRTDEALAMVRRLRAADDSRTLVADEAGLLVAAGRPAAAQALFRP